MIVLQKRGQVLAVGSEAVRQMTSSILRDVRIEFIWVANPDLSFPREVTKLFSISVSSSVFRK